MTSVYVPLRTAAAVPPICWDFSGSVCLGLGHGDSVKSKPSLEAPSSGTRAGLEEVFIKDQMIERSSKLCPTIR